MFLKWNSRTLALRRPTCVAASDLNNVRIGRSSIKPSPMYATEPIRRLSRQYRRRRSASERARRYLTIDARDVWKSAPQPSNARACALTGRTEGAQDLLWSGMGGVVPRHSNSAYRLSAATRASWAHDTPHRTHHRGASPRFICLAPARNGCGGHESQSASRRLRLSRHL